MESLSEEVTNIKQENQKLVETRKALGVEVTTLGNKMKVLDGEMKNLEKTRDMLDSQVSVGRIRRREVQLFERFKYHQLTFILVVLFCRFNKAKNKMTNLEMILDNSEESKREWLPSLLIKEKLLLSLSRN